MTPIENQEIKGVTIRLLYAIVVSTATIVITVACVYFGLKGKTDLTQLQVDVLKVQLENVIIDQKELRQRIEKLEAK